MRTQILLRSALPALLLCGTVKAQDICDQIIMESISYAPFSNGLDVVMYNGNDEFLSYPRVQFIDANGDTLGIDAMTFFGIAPHTAQQHLVETNGPPPQSPLTGTLLFHYIDQNGNGRCHIPITAASLCPDTVCSPVEVGIFLGPGAPATDLDWTITNASGTTMAQGSLSIAPGGEVLDADPVCLPPGEYTLHAEQTSMPVQEFPLILASPDFDNGHFLKGMFDASGHLSMSLPFFTQCAAIGQSVEDRTPTAPKIRVEGKQLHISMADERPIGGSQLLDVQGRVLKQERTNGSSTAIMDLSAYPGGIYLLRSTDPTRPWQAQRFFLP